jgi:tRNA-Thr(GGU) m(6)t(6)A37 methyltransferase TsaA
MISAKGESGIVRFIGTVKEVGEFSTIVVHPKFCSGLMGIEEYSHLIILFWIHLRDNNKHRSTLQVTPPRHEGAPLTGVFACRSPSRPNPIGLTVVELVEVKECKIKVRGLDALKGSPIVDIKPYSARAESRPDAHGPVWSKQGPPT